MHPETSRRVGRRWAGLCLCLAAGTLASAAGAQETGPVSPDSLIQSVRWLADDAREGRLTGSRGAREAADWLASLFADYGFEPAGDKGSFFQNFSVTVGVELGRGNELAVTVDGRSREFTAGKDFSPFGFSNDGTVEAPVVFAGYGISAPDLGYDDYDDVDVAGKLVLVMRHEPQQRDRYSVFNGTEHSPHAYFRNKAEAAREHGAVGMLLFTGPLSREAREDVLLPVRRDSPLEGDFLAVHVRAELGAKLLELADLDATEWAKEVDRDLQPRSVLLPRARIRLGVDIASERRDARNVVAVLRGTDPDAGAIMLGAHYDHLGFGEHSSLAPDRAGEVHNGADDNASGTAGLVELARVLGRDGPYRRTLVLAAFTGEELGLLGSQYMASHPPLPDVDLAAMLNMDMIGRPVKGRVMVGGTQTSDQLAGALDTAIERSELRVRKRGGGTGPSDHTSFYQQDVPVLFFFTGTHTDYHKPTDDIERIDPEGLAAVTDLVRITTLSLLTWDGEIELARSFADESGDGTTFLGTIPDQTGIERGVRMASVLDGGPADRAGMRSGDVVLSLNGRRVDTVEELLDAIRSHDPGDRVNVILMRGGSEVELAVVLGSR